LNPKKQEVKESKRDPWFDMTDEERKQKNKEYDERDKKRKQEYKENMIMKIFII
jgi:hypothetical protein